ELHYIYLIDRDSEIAIEDEGYNDKIMMTTCKSIRVRFLACTILKLEAIQLMHAALLFLLNPFRIFRIFTLLTWGLRSLIFNFFKIKGAGQVHAVLMQAAAAPEIHLSAAAAAAIDIEK
ncbi:hypothetical protein ACJX0J_038896, partial [Zea mays]